jgi:HK97 family phage portal protein
MGFMEWAVRRLGFMTPAQTRAVSVPPARLDSYGYVDEFNGTTLTAVFRAFQLIETAAEQVSLDVYRAGRRLEAGQLPSIARRPSLDMDDLSEFVGQTVTSLMATGNAYWMLNRPTGSGVNDLELLDPHEVGAARDPQTRRVAFEYRGLTYGTDQIKQVALLRLPGQPAGLGPIQAAQHELRGALELRDYSALWFSQSKIPSGILTSDQALSAEDAKRYRDAWNGTDSTPVDNPSGVRVLGRGTDFKPLFLKPADAQWLESRQYSTTEIARLFGVPASLLMAAVDGSAMTYQNVQQEWIAFSRFTLASYLRKIERALTTVLPAGQTARFNYDALLRTDTLTRYQAHGLAVGRWMTVDEVRGIEDMPPLTAAQRGELAPKTAPAPASPPPIAAPAPPAAPQDEEAVK